MRESLYSDGAKQGTQAPSPAPRLIPAKTEDQLRTNIAIWYSKRGHFIVMVGVGLIQLFGGSDTFLDDKL